MGRENKKGIIGLNRMTDIYNRCFGNRLIELSMEAEIHETEDDCSYNSQRGK